jgi:hypothetical protein
VAEVVDGLFASFTRELLPRLYGSQFIDRCTTDKLLLLHDRAQDVTDREALLEVLLYSSEESYVVEQISLRYKERETPDTLYPILSAFPAQRVMLAMFEERFERVPIPSAAAAEALGCLVWSSGICGNNSGTSRVARIIEAQIERESNSKTRGILIRTLVYSANDILPAVFERWWRAETDDRARKDGLDALCTANRANVIEWARAFLEAQIQTPMAPELRLVAQDSLRRLTPTEKQ